MVAFDKFLYQYRFIIGSVLIVIILAGSGFFIWQKIDQNRQKENNEVALLQEQNDLLRAQLAGQSQQVAGASDVTEESTGEKININSATLEQLDTLPGIGPAYANGIITYRDSNGGFKTIEEIKNIKGIGDKTFEKLADLITVGQ